MLLHERKWGQKIAQIARIAPNPKFDFPKSIFGPKIAKMYVSEVSFVIRAIPAFIYFSVPLFGVGKRTDLGTAERAVRIAIIYFGSLTLQSEQSELDFSIRAIRVKF